MQLKLKLKKSMKTTGNMATVQFYHSHSVLQALKSNTFNCAMLSEIQLLLYQALVKEINNLCWVLGQLGVGGNRNTDALAESTTTNIGKLMLTDMMGVIKSAVRTKWQRYWWSLKYRGLKFWDIKPIIEV